jgi:hypothetical protein
MGPAQAAALESAFAAMAAGDIPQAIRIYRGLLASASEDPNLHVPLGQLLLLSGDLEAGWEECEWRDQRPLPLPRWRGAPLKGAAILLHGEQGFGDNFQFVRYARLVADRGGRVVLATLKGLRRLLATVPGVAEVIEDGEAIPPVACHIPMMSLPYLFATRLDTIPNTVPYISADPVKVAAWRERLAPVPGLRVGLVWSGNLGPAYNSRRSPGLAAVAPLLDCPGVTVFALQKGGGRADLAGQALPRSFIDLDLELKSFDDTAAAMTALDLVISPCTSTAHLAGALGRPVWVMLASTADWRWLRNRDDSPWYPTARLFRQTVAGDWTGPVMRMRGELEKMASNSPSLREAR